jgi:MtN3 and saliva related transmembrane protein
MDGVPIWLVNAIGVTAGLCSIASFVPQIVKIVREHDASGVSLRMYVVSTIGFICWTLFGVLSGSWPVTLANAICLALVVTILTLRLRIGG